MPDRKALHAYLDDDTFDAWQTFAGENGVSATGLLEALGRSLAKEIADAGDACEVRGDWVRSARRVDAERRRRSPR